MAYSQITLKTKHIHIYIYIYIYISNIQSAFEDDGNGLFVHIIYEEFHINLWEGSMYGHCYIFSIQVYITKLTYRAYTIQLDKNSNLVCFSEFISVKNIIILFVSSDYFTHEEYNDIVRRHEFIMII